MWSLLFAVWGLALGSFIAALTYRLPRNISITTGRSFCPNCKHQIAWFDNVPLFSYLFLHGKCRNCKKAISKRYPVIEFLGLVVGLVTPYVSDAASRTIPWLGAVSTFRIFFVFALLLLFLAIIITDFEFQIIPDEFVFSLLCIVMFVILLSSTPVFFASMASGFSAALFLLTLHLVTSGRGMGLGDVKLALPLGLLFGYPLTLVWMFSSFVSGAVVGLFMMLVGSAGMKTKLAFGPFLIFGAIVTLIWGQYLLSFFI